MAWSQQNTYVATAGPDLAFRPPRSTLPSNYSARQQHSPHLHRCPPYEPEATGAVEPASPRRRESSRVGRFQKRGRFMLEDADRLLARRSWKTGKEIVEAGARVQDKKVRD